MRSFYEIEAEPEKPAPGQDGRVRLFLQLAVIVFWAPSAGIDLLLLWRDHSDGELGFVFWLLFRQSLVFLTLWFTVSIIHGLARGRRSWEPSRAMLRRLRRKTASAAAVTPGRAYRGQ